MDMVSTKRRVFKLFAQQSAPRRHASMMETRKNKISRPVFLSKRVFVFVFGNAAETKRSDLRVVGGPCTGESKGLAHKEVNETDKRYTPPGVSSYTHTHTHTHTNTHTVQIRSLSACQTRAQRHNTYNTPSEEHTKRTEQPTSDRHHL